MTTPSRPDINRGNAQHSTGPKTEAGKQKSSLNALSHGLTSQIVVMPMEDLAAYRQHLQSFTDELQPVGVIEANLVQALADCSWRLNRIVALESKLLITIETSGGPDLRALSSLSMHSQRLSRQFERTVNQLRDLQESRRDQEQYDLSSLLDILQMHKDKGETYDPLQNGFVFSESQIAAALLLRRREQLAEEAYEHCLEAAAYAA